MEENFKYIESKLMLLEANMHEHIKVAKVFTAIKEEYKKLVKENEQFKNPIKEPKDA